MARQPKMINNVITLLGEGNTGKEIVEKTGCSASTVTVARKRLKDRAGDLSKATADIEADVDENVDSFINEIEITPDPDVLTQGKDNDAEKSELYQCPSCRHEWTASGVEIQESCPSCGEEFE